MVCFLTESIYKHSGWFKLSNAQLRGDTFFAHMDTLWCWNHIIMEIMSSSKSITGWYDSYSSVINSTPHVVSHKSRSTTSLSLQASNKHTYTETQWSPQFNMNYHKQTLGSVGQQSVPGERLMMEFYCSRRSRSSKLFFCSLQGTQAAAVRIHSALCFYTERR